MLDPSTVPLHLAVVDRHFISVTKSSRQEITCACSCHYTIDYRLSLIAIRIKLRVLGLNSRLGFGGC